MGITPCSSILIYLQVANKQVAITAVPSEYRANSTWLKGCNDVQVWPEEHGKVQLQSFKVE
jgi:hypothetical protein